MKKSNVGNYIHKYNIKSYYIRLLLVFGILLAIVVYVVGSFTYYKASNVIRNKVDEANLEVLYQAQQSVDNMMEKVNTLILNISSFYLFQTDYEELSIQDKLSMKNGSFFSFKKEEYINSVYIYYFKSEKIIRVMSADSGITDFAQFRDKDWLQTVNDAKDLNDKTLYIEDRDLKKDGGSTKVISVITGFPLNSDHKMGVIVANIDKDKMFGGYRKYLQDAQMMLVLNSRGNLIYGDNQYLDSLLNNKMFDITNEEPGSYLLTDKKNSENLIATRVVSSQNGWNYVKIQNANFLNNDTKTLKSFALLLGVFCFIVGLLIWGKVANGIYFPIVTLLEKVLNTGNVKYEVAEKNYNEMQLLDELVGNVIVQKDSIQSLYQKSSQDITTGLLVALSNNEEIDYEYLSDQMRELSFPIKDHDFNVVIVRIDKWELLNSKYGTEQRFRIKNVIKELVESEFNNVFMKQLSAYIQDDKLMLLISNTKGDEFLMKVCYRAQEIVKNDYHLRMTFGIGRTFRDLLFTYQAYNEAIEALTGVIFDAHGSVIHIDSFSVQGDLPKYYYPIAKEIKFMDAVKKGDTETAIELMEQIYLGIPKTLEMANYVPDLLWQLVNSIFLSMSTMGIKYEEVLEDSLFNNYQQYKTLDTVEDMLEFIKDRIRLFHDYIENKRNSKNDQIIEQMKKYIDENYGEKISLNDVAAFVYMSPSYTSIIFKENTGENLSDYIKKIRMEKAKEILRRGNCIIEKIAQDVGYDNSRSFNRAFKAFTGMTPSEYRKIN